MRFACVLVAMLAVSARAQPACQPAEAAQRKIAEIDAANHKRLAAALDARGLHAITLAWHDRQVDDTDRFHSGDVRAGEVLFSVTVPCSSRADAGFAFVADKHGNVYRLIEEHKTSSPSVVLSCGCRTYSHGCGIGPRRSVVVFALPAKASYKGDVHVEYEFDDMQVSYARQGCPGPPKVP